MKLQNSVSEPCSATRFLVQSSTGQSLQDSVFSCYIEEEESGLLMLQSYLVCFQAFLTKPVCLGWCKLEHQETVGMQE